MSRPPSLRRPSRRKRAAALALLLGLGSLADCRPATPPTDRAGVVGLATSLPLFWSEAGDIRGQLSPDTSVHWAKGVLAQHGRLFPLDRLANSRGQLPLPADALLVVAQPRPLTRDENLALDTWVRNGGRLLLFADPMLTGSSRFGLGDPRRPQDVVMLSPILRHWGLKLRFDDSQAAGEHAVPIRGMAYPVDLPGSFGIEPNPAAACAIESGGILAECRVGRGRVVAVADAALLEDGTGITQEGARVRNLQSLIETLVKAP